MGLAHSPKITTNGLVFYYDSGNTSKSWLGAPTTNLLSDPTHFDNTTYWSNYGTSSLIAPTTLVYAPDGTTTAYAFSAKNTLGYHTVYQNYNFTAGVTYTQSVYVKAGTLSTFFLQYASGPFSTWISCTYNLSTGTLDNPTNGIMTNIGDGWYRCSLTAAAANTAAGPGLYMYPSGSQYTGSNTLTPPEVYIWRGQLEVSPFMTPFVDGVRSNTQSIIDLTGQNIITANSLTYAANNTFRFNGSNNMIIIPNNTTLDSQTITMESWVNAASLNQNGFIFEKGTVNTQYSNFFSGGTFYFRTMGLTPQDLTFAVSSYITINQWYHIVCTYGSGTKTIYVNGNQVAQATGVTGTLATSTGGMSVGVYGGYSGVRGYYFNGSIAVCKVYNTALTIDQVRQNFNALRGRFGL